ncbi:unnamed protein product [Onchocerca ochengi]|uniref:Uncharacterized protein n=1 Tax=Onchocerca ochengi TaxID=42157 RepID=A0A182E4C4_ONCOC|nr:unnamed protein product [Onchocerca ochengi]
MEADKAVKRIFEFIRFASDTTARTAIENRHASYHVAKYQPAKTLQRHAASSRRTLRTEALRRLIANQIEEEPASANERKRQKMAQMRAEQHATRLENAWLRAHRSCSAASNLLCSEE